VGGLPAKSSRPGRPLSVQQVSASR